MLTKMNWLDSTTPISRPSSQPGVMRGPCSRDAGDPTQLRGQYPDAHVTYSNIMVGEIGTTYGAAAKKAKAAAAATPVSAPAPMTVPVTVPQSPASPASPASVKSATVSGAVCCSSSKTAHKCGSCWQGGVMKTG